MSLEPSTLFQALYPMQILCIKGSGGYLLQLAYLVAAIGNKWEVEPQESS